MDALSKNSSDPNWWMTVVAFGIVINLFSAYLKPALDRMVIRVYPRMAGFFRRGTDAFDAEIATLRASSEHRVATQLLKIEYLVKIVGALLLSGL